MSESPEDKKKDSKVNSDLSDIVQWSGNLAPPPPPEINDENILEIPPPPPLNGMDLPPPPPPAGDLIPPPPEPDSVEIPDIEIPPPPALEIETKDLLDTLPPPPMPEQNNPLAFSIPGELSETMEEIIDVTEVEDSDYKELWKRTSDKPLQQVYGHIDRLGTGEVGSLLDRYADRFGSELFSQIPLEDQDEIKEILSSFHWIVSKYRLNN